ncbi:MAG: hypothetical protein V3R77_04750 [Candidatus Binatia bacterium]
MLSLQTAQGGAAPRTALVAAALVVAIVTAGAAEAQQTKQQQACINATHKAFAGVAKAQGKLVSACIKAGAAGKLAEASVEVCTTVDTKGKVTKAASKASASVAGKCTQLPDFGPNDPTGATAIQRGKDARQALIRDVLGNDLDAAVISSATDGAGAKCQSAVVKVLDKCWNAYLKSFSTCAKKGLKGSIADADGLEACRSDDPKGKVAKACDEKLQAVLDRSCAGEDFDVITPGCVCQDGRGCLELGTVAAANTALDTVANLPTAAPVVPVVRAPQADVGEPWLRPATGEEFVASLVVGREHDAPLLCSLGAMNIHTVQDPASDAAYNIGILPLLLDQGVRIFFLGDGPVDVLGSSPPALVQQQHALPLYAGAADFLMLATRAETHPLAPLKNGQVGDTLRFGLQECLHDCAALETSTFPPFVFSGRLLLLHFDAERSAIETSVPLLAAEASTTTGVTLAWAGRTVADFNIELADGTVVETFNPLPADGTLVYILDASVDPAAEVLTLPEVSAFLALTTSDAIVLFE